MRSNYYGMLRLIDDQVKVLAQALAHEGLRDNTLLLFISDHGDFVGDYGLMRKGPEVPEDLMRIPFLVSGPGVARHRGPHPAHVSLVDIMPTLCEAIGVDPVPGVQGKSLWPLLAGEPYPAEEFASVYAEHGFGGLDYGWEDGPDYEKCSPHEIRFDCLNQYTQCGTRRMLRRGRWKLVFDARGAGQLYDLDADPAELANRFEDPSCAEERWQLVEELLTAVLRAQDPLPLPGEPYRPKIDPRNYWSAQPSVRRDRPQH
jgi:arylsulfatase A-like enzyme